ncbi:hypothetical protein GTQ40_00585 [Flavobacteriaceae bacterium R38]|nr:hypothetical protein [Flavobacteriaceae bacterium R38]
MALNNFEEQIKEKFSSRMIEPSENAWELLEKKMVQKKTNRFNYRYLYGAVAAVFIGIMVMLNFINTDVKNDNEPSVVESNPPTIEDSVTEKYKEQEIDFSKEPVLTQVEETEKEAPKKEDVLIKDNIIQNQEVVEIDNDKTLLMNTKKETLESLASVEQKKDSLIDKKVIEVLASISELNEQNGAVTDAEINALLDKAQKEINAQRILKNNKVDATALLLDVEGEIDRSFRDKVFEAIKNGYSKVKTAVAERNH